MSRPLKTERRRAHTRNREASPFDLPLGQRVRSGMEYGLILGSIFSIVALINAAFHGGEVALRGGGSVSLVAVLVSYLLFGPLTGALFGAFFPWMRSRIVAYIIGVVVSMPIGLAILVGLQGLWPWTTIQTLTLTIMALTLGGIGGILVREITLWRPTRV